MTTVRGRYYYNGENYGLYPVQIEPQFVNAVEYLYALPVAVLNCEAYASQFALLLSLPQVEVVTFYIPPEEEE